MKFKFDKGDRVLVLLDGWEYPSVVGVVENRRVVSRLDGKSLEYIVRIDEQLRQLEEHNLKEATCLK